MAISSNREFHKKYSLLVQKYNRVVTLLKKTRHAFGRLLRNYNRLKQHYLFSIKTANREKSMLLTRTLAEKYPLVLDHSRRIRHVSDEFLEEIDMSKPEFEGSIFLDVLFEKFLPNNFENYADVDIPEFHFPVMLKNYVDEPGLVMHPFIHFLVSGKMTFNKKRKLFLYFLEIKDITSTVELDYFQKTDKLIKNLSISNINLQKAKKTIEMHKVLLISLVCSLIEDFNKETSTHLQNIRMLTTCLTEECKRLNIVPPVPYDQDEFLKDINYTSVLHDIGKMGIPVQIISKKGKLTPEEFEIIKGHPQYGSNHLQKIIDTFKHDPSLAGYLDFLQIPHNICLHHHERWDGKGYPSGLSGTDIPFCARVVALVDSYDAMRAQRSYNVQKTHQEALDVIRAESGRQFDPELVQAFVNVEKKLEGMGS